MRGLPLISRIAIVVVGAAGLIDLVATVFRALPLQTGILFFAFTIIAGFAIHKGHRDPARSRTMVNAESLVALVAGTAFAVVGVVALLRQT